MNPDENNPLANPGMPDYGAVNNPVGAPTNDIAAMDNFSMAGDSLTAAGMAAAPTMPGPINLDQASDAQPPVSPFAPIDEPLAPAAPVPGSIGSASSAPTLPSTSAPAPITPVSVDSAAVPPVAVPADPLPNPFASVNSATPASEPAAGSAPVAEAQSQSAPYNPFAQSAPAPAAAPSPMAASAPVSDPTKPFMTPAKNTINPAFQPAPSTSTKAPKSHRSISPLTAILGVTTAILLITTIIFVVLFVNAKNNPKVVYVPTVSGGDESETNIELLSCSRSEDYSWMVDFVYPVVNNINLTANYSNGELSALTSEYHLAFASEEDANNGRTTLENAVLNLPFQTIAEYSVDGNNLNANIQPATSPLTADAAMNFIYGTTEGEPSLTLDAVRAHLEGQGGVCSVE